MIPKTYHLEKELFEIPCQEGSLIYAPLRRTILWTDKGAVNLICDLQDGKPVDLVRHEKPIRTLLRLHILYPASVQEKRTPKRQTVLPATTIRPFFRLI